MRPTPRDLLTVLATLGLGVGASVATAQIAFTDVTDASGAGHFSESYGASWGDLDGDGYPDLFTSNHRTQPSLFLNMGDGKTFVDVGAQTLDWQNRPHADTHGGSWADYNNDGQQDLMISTGTGNLSQFLVNQNQRLVDLTVPLGLGITNLGGRLPVWLDYDKDGRLDVVVTQYGGVAKLFHQKPDGTFIDATTSVKLLCKRFHYAQLLDVNNDGQVDFVCPDETLFPQKVYDFKPLPWKKLFDSATPASFFPLVSSVADSAIADFNNDGLMDVFVLGGVQLRPSSVVQGNDTHFEAMLAGGSKGATWVTTGAVTFKMDWNKAADDGAGTDITKVLIGAGGKHPTSSLFTLDPTTDPTVAGMPPAPDANTPLPVLEIGYDTPTNQWTMKVVTRLDANGVAIFSQGYFEVTSTAPITGLTATGLWPGDLPASPTLLMNNGGSFVNKTAGSGLEAPVQCVSVTPGDFDNDMFVDLYLACRTGASNIANILYHNNGNGTFTAVTDAGGAAGPIGLAIANHAGTADSVVSADYDVDGFLDLYVTNGFNLRPLYIGGPNKLYHNDSKNGNHWIEIDLVGVNSDRDATGARIYATASNNGKSVTQLRVQNGAYHRWSQDAKRAHFGLASATTVDLRVEWPSGATDIIPNVAADQLYRITEGSAIAAPVALGIAPAYQCGPPPLNGATDSGVFIWRDCPSGQWRLKTASAGGTITYTGTVTSSGAYTGVAGVGLSADDSLDYTTNPSQIAFSFKTVGKSTDGVNFTAPNSASGCLQITAPGVTQVYFGPFRVPVNQPFNLDTQASCP